MAANVETMFYTRTAPWHGLGTRVLEAPTSSAALSLAGLEGDSETGSYRGWTFYFWLQSECER